MDAFWYVVSAVWNVGMIGYFRAGCAKVILTEIMYGGMSTDSCEGF